MHPRLAAETTTMKLVCLFTCVRICFQGFSLKYFNRKKARIKRNKTESFQNVAQLRAIAYAVEEWKAAHEAESF